MFISVNQLEQEMGVDRRIGRFFVDRQVPASNGYWKGRLLYISFGDGYLFIPVYYDLLRRIGVALELLLDERHINFMEMLMHYSYLHEAKEITFLGELAFIEKMLEGRIQDLEYFDALRLYLKQPILNPLGRFGLPFPALNRADVFLMILCDLPLSKQQLEKAIRYWYCLVPNYLIHDDFKDFQEDREKGEENVIIDQGVGFAGFEKTIELYRQNCTILQEINPELSSFLLQYGEKLRSRIPSNF